jgi:biopolymer transport protein ExbD
VGGRVRDDSSESQRRRGTRTPNLFHIIDVVVVVLVFFAYFRLG